MVQVQVGYSRVENSGSFAKRVWKMEDSEMDADVQRKVARLLEVIRKVNDREELKGGV